jgi:hypothetical protein
MVVTLIDQRNRDRRSRQSVDGLKPAKARADNDDGVTATCLACLIGSGLVARIRHVKVS